MNSETNPFSVEPVEMITAQESPRQASQKYSNEENWMANSARAGALADRTMDPVSPPITDVTSAIPRARSASPFLVIA